jgi:hypothetical protein
MTGLGRRALLAGASIALAAADTALALAKAPKPAAPLTGNLDSALILACADFQLACVEQRRRHVTDAESDAMSDAFYATLARVDALHPTTPAGLRAKVLAARTALMDQIHNFIDKDWREEASPEERVVIDTLQHILDGVAL